MARIDIRQDIGPAIDSSYVVAFMDSELLEVSHQISENFYPVFSMSHEVLGHVAASTFDSGGLYRPFDLGVKTYEALAGTNYSQAVPDIEAIDLDDSSDVEAARYAAAAFANSVSNESDFHELLDKSRDIMIVDAPVLTDIVTEIADVHLPHDKGAVKLALAGAAVMRSMHIARLASQGRE